jgi:glycosidase
MAAQDPKSLHPLVYELNTRCWLRELSERTGSSVTLATVAENELMTWRRLGFTHIWLMGVWQVGPRSRAHSLSLHQPGQPLEPYREEDIVGSAYAIADYHVSERLGGDGALKQFRQRLSGFGLKLLLDFVPNHVGLDDAWLDERPELFVQSAEKKAGTFLHKTRTGERWIAHGRDPYFHPWIDTAQLDYRNPATRGAMMERLKSVAQRCDGVRCDMAMLVLNDVFQKTWTGFPARAVCPNGEFWAEAISTVRSILPDFLFLAEVYWDLEKRLQGLGFDYTYDKRLYDHRLARRHDLAQRHLLDATPNYLRASVHFLENHDEARVASVLSMAEHRGAALVLLGSPGMRLLHEGQLTGATQRVSVQVNRRPDESPNGDITALYETLLTTLQRTSVGKGDFAVLRPSPAWPENPTAQNFIVVRWQSEPEEFDLVVVNLASHASQCYVPLEIPGRAERRWQLSNLLGPERWERPGRDFERGLYLDLPPHGAQLLHFQPLRA